MTLTDDVVERVAKAIAHATIEAAEPEKYGRLSDAGIASLAENIAVKFYPEARAALEAARYGEIQQRVRDLEQALRAIDQSAFIGVTTDSEQTLHVAIESIHDIASDALLSSIGTQP